MCIGGGGYEPPKMVKGPDPVARGESPPDRVNNQAIDDANPRSEMEDNRNAIDPPKNKEKLKPQSGRNTGSY